MWRRAGARAALAVARDRPASAREAREQVSPNQMVRVPLPSFRRESCAIGTSGRIRGYYTAVWRRSIVTPQFLACPVALAAPAYPRAGRGQGAPRRAPSLLLVMSQPAANPP